MRQTTGIRKSPGEKLVKDIKRAIRKQYSSEEKIHIVLDGLRGEDRTINIMARTSPLRYSPPTKATAYRCSLRVASNCIDYMSNICKNEGRRRNHNIYRPLDNLGYWRNSWEFSI
ncbi:hypothetical protein N9777_03200 [Ascidiaceihabitans sp.]|nr:hypothetical protein [Ascidiaceihabitans sp.]